MSRSINVVCSFFENKASECLSKTTVRICNSCNKASTIPLISEKLVLTVMPNLYCSCGKSCSRGIYVLAISNNCNTSILPAFCFWLTKSDGISDLLMYSISLEIVFASFKCSFTFKSRADIVSAEIIE